MVGGKSNQGDWITASSSSSEGGCFGDEIALRLVRGRRGKSLAAVLNHGRPLAVGGLGPPSAAMDGGQVIDRMAEGVSSSFCLNPRVLKRRRDQRVLWTAMVVPERGKS
jgi:hypothetical protein